jgi:hypothetical protein
LLLVTACQTVFGIDETDPLTETGVGASGGASAAQSSASSGSAGATAAASGGTSDGGHGGGGGTGQAGSSGGEGCAPDQAGDELLADGNMEAGVDLPGDGDWLDFESTLDEETTVVHGGSKAALLCATTQNQEYFSAYIDVLAAGTIEVGQRYVASACVRNHPNYPAPQQVLVRLREQGFKNVDTDSTPAMVPSAFQRIVTPEMVVTEAGNTKISFHVLGWDPLDDVCVVFDSAHVVRLPPL